MAVEAEEEKEEESYSTSLSLSLSLSFSYTSQLIEERKRARVREGGENKKPIEKGQ